MEVARFQNRHGTEVLSLIRLFLIKENLSSLRLVIMREAAGGEGTAVEVPRLQEGSAGGAEAAPDAEREVRSFDCVAVLWRAGCLKGLEWPTGEKGKRRSAQRW